MSNVSNATANTNTESTSSEKKEEGFVPRNAYEEVSKDMHKYKSANKELAAKVSEYEARMKALADSKLEEEKRFEELYRKEQDERKKAEDALKKTNEHYIKSVKMTALMRELGNIKPKYLQHAALDEIIVHEDGSLSSESVIAVANKFRQENPELVPAGNVGNLNDSAPASETFKNEKPLDLEALSKDKEALRNVLAKAPRTTVRRGVKDN